MYSLVIYPFLQILQRHSFYQFFWVSPHKKVPLYSFKQPRPEVYGQPKWNFTRGKM